MSACPQWSQGSRPNEVTLRFGNYEYLIRDDGDYGVTLMQQNRCTKMIEQRRECEDSEQAYLLAENWMTSAAIAGGPW